MTTKLNRTSALALLSDSFDFNSCNDIFKSVFNSERFYAELEDLEFEYGYILKILVIQRYYDLTSKETYSLITDRISLMKFLGTTPSEISLSSQTIDHLKKELQKDDQLEKIFSRLDLALSFKGLKVNRGRFTEFTIVETAHPLSPNISEDQIEGGKDQVSEIYIPNIQYPIKLRTNTSDLATLKEVFVDNGYYFNKEYYFGHEFVPSFIVDCGANIGLTSVYFKSRFPEAFIVAIEPEKSNFDILEYNLSYYYPTIDCLKRGIWNKTAHLSVKDENNSGKWGFIVKEIPESNDESVASITIDNLLDKYSREQIDILKVDIEGAELELFQSGYERWLPNTRSILIETHDRFRKGCCKSVFNALGKYDFVISFNKNTIICINTAFTTMP